MDNAARRTLVQISPLQPTFGALPVEMTRLTGATYKRESHTRHYPGNLPTWMLTATTLSDTSPSRRIDSGTSPAAMP